MACFRGTIYTSARLFAETHFGPGAVSRVLSELEPEERALLEAIEPDGWYPTAPVLRFHHQLDALFGHGDLLLCRELGRYSAEWALSSFLRFFLRFTSPQWIFDRAGSLWDRYHDTGRWVLAPRASANIRGELWEFGVADRAFCVRLTGWLLGAIELTGGRGAEIHEVRCRALGDECCEFVGIWEGA